MKPAIDSCLVASPDRRPCSPFSRFSSRPSPPRLPPRCPKRPRPFRQHARPDSPRPRICRCFLPIRTRPPRRTWPRCPSRRRLVSSPLRSGSSASYRPTHPRLPLRQPTRRTSTSQPTSSAQSAARSRRTPPATPILPPGRRPEQMRSKITHGSRNGSALVSADRVRRWPVERGRTDVDFRSGRRTPTYLRTRRALREATPTPLTAVSRSSTPRPPCHRPRGRRRRHRPRRPPLLAAEEASRRERNQTGRFSRR